MSERPHDELRRYLAEIGAPDDAMEHITKRLGWNPPPLWEASHVKADEINAQVVTPAGMRHVGWYCQHPTRREPPYDRETVHRSPSFKNKRGWKLDKNVSRSLSCGDYDYDIHCPQRVPVFIADAEVSSDE